MKDLRRFWIIFKCVAYTFYMLLSFLSLKYRGKLSREKVAFFCKKWSQTSMKFANIELKVTGAAPLDKPGLLVGNHVSYIDIPAVMSVLYAVFVSKKEVAYWPVFGQAATAVGTIFLNRDSAESRRNVAMSLSRAVEENSRCICLFPEGTSSLWGKTWKKGSFQIAERFEFPVQAFALKYKPIWDAAYIDDDTLLTHLWKLLGHEKIEVEIVLSI